ncbi:tyrosine-type recombinase/integrase [Thiomicrorhabdus xiamenensis]|uniref:Tyrosine-type recombinase/integrase n=1 Tax=Thiomicrorhabdus xiamenensis TaxID=2739063 RepID=A0A7D4SHN9_9GAMM|nr:tyrosine-type recombinase/integrase [Thiomicrorhabdus xiamenensis]QKI88540.1 tyrosine-type recombinase/integrase [Thiomicrorhabdus xiamenensis]
MAEKNEFPFTVEELDSISKKGTYYDSHKKANGLYLRIKNKGGAKSFKVGGRINGKQIEVSLGTYPKTTIEQARKKARAAQDDFAEGINPNQKKKFQRTKQATLAEMLELYLQMKALKPRTVRGYRSSFRLVLSPLANTPITEIDYSKILKIHKDYAKRSQAEADRAMRLLRAIFNMAMDEIRDLNGNPLILENPVKKLSKNKQFTRLERKTRKLEDDQIKPFLDTFEELATDSRPFYQIGADLALVLFYHGTRITETASMKWEQVEIKYKRFYLTETKNGRRLWLPMTSESEKVFKRRKKLSTRSQFVFPSATNNEKHISDIKKPLRHLLEQTGVEITAHDLRRTFLSTGARLGFNDHLLKQLANHALSNDVTAGYIIQNADELREPSQRITNTYLEKAGRTITDTDSKLNELVKNLSDAEKQHLIMRLLNQNKAV